MEIVTIGYFGVPGKMGHLTHLSDGKKPLCGTRLHPEAIYQWCLPSWRHGDPECERCKKIRLGWLIDFNENKTPDIPVKTPSKTNMAVHFSSNTNEWTTPLPLFYWLDQQYHFTLDPCCTKETRLCKKYYTKAEDGLVQDWGKERVFMNPPYGREIGDWVKKAYEASRLGATVICLIPARTDTKWWKDYCLQANDAIFLTGRIKFFENGVALKAGAPFPSVIVAFHPPFWPRVGLNCQWRDYKEIESIYRHASRNDLHL